MLASLLTNEPFGGVPSGCDPKPWRKTGMYGGKFIMVDGYMRNIEDEKPEPKIVKRVLKALGTLSLTKAEQTDLAAIKYDLQGISGVSTAIEKAKQLRAYLRAVEMLIEAVEREEAEEFIALLMVV